MQEEEEEEEVGIYLQLHFKSEKKLPRRLISGERNSKF